MHAFANLTKLPLAMTALVLFMLVPAWGSDSGTAPATPLSPETACAASSCSTVYEVGFFDIYAPVTALDMVNNLPGFSINDGNTGARGFGGAAGNILINGERVSSKSEAPSDILANIPAADVSQIIVIRGQGSGTDLRGQNTIANVIRIGGRATGTWSVRGSSPQPGARLGPSGSFSYSNSVGALSYTFGSEGGRSYFRNQSEEQVLTADGSLLELRDEGYSQSRDDLELNLNGTYYGAATRYGFNIRLEREDRDGSERSLRTPNDQATFLLVQRTKRQEDELEFGVDAERSFGARTSAKLIALYRQEDDGRFTDLVQGPPDAPGQIDTEAITDRTSTEKILRLEADYFGFQDHLFEASVEGAINRLDSDFRLFESDGLSLVPVPVPGARTEVEEQRLDLSISDSFSVGALAVDLEIAAEASEISQTGGFAEERSFFYWKPSAILTYPLDDNSLIRSRVRRRVSQLNFSDFVSAADLGDDELSLGNPTLTPETTTTLDVTWEYRSDGISSVSLTTFYDWIKDVEDVLPLQDGLETPGNIGSGWRYGLRGKITSPLESLGLANARLDIDGRWQNSGVTDPVTGGQRVLSNERAWRVEASIRQDLPTVKLGWSLSGSLRDGFKRFGLDEIDQFEGSGNLSGYIESRAIESLRIRFGINSILKSADNRNREVYERSRASSALSFREFRDRNRSRSIYLEVRGVF